MTTDSSPSGWHRLHLAATRIAHWQPIIVAAAFVSFVLSKVTGDDGWAIANTALTWLVIVVLACDAYHVRVLCARCAAKTPLDGPAEATRLKDWLWIYHRTVGRAWLGLTLCAGCIAAGIVLSIRSGIEYAPVYALWTVESIAALRHRPVQPWCPHCNPRGWDGGHAETAPVPPYAISSR